MQGNIAAKDKQDWARQAWQGGRTVPEMLSDHCQDMQGVPCGRPF